MQAYATTFGVPAVITRCSNNYGPYQFPEKLIPLFVTNALDGEPLPLYGDGAERARLDPRERPLRGALARARPPGCRRAGVERERARTSARTGRSPTTILGLTGRPRDLVRHVTDRPGHDRRYALDAGRLRATGWAPRWTFEDGLAATVEWYRAHRAWWEAVKSGAYRDYYRSMYGDRLRDGAATPARRGDA